MFSECGGGTWHRWLEEILNGFHVGLRFFLITCKCPKLVVGASVDTRVVRRRCGRLSACRGRYGPWMQEGSRRPSDRPPLRVDLCGRVNGEKKHGDK